VGTPRRVIRNARWVLLEAQDFVGIESSSDRGDSCLIR
jgi:hypothetical protein